MSITISFWWLPVISVVLGVMGAWLLGGRKSDYDMASPMIGLGCVILGIAVAIALCVGRWLS